MAQPIESPAFRLAALRTERQRLIIILGLCTICAALVIASPILYGSGPKRLGLYLGCWLFLAAYETVTLLIAQYAYRAGRPRPHAFGVLHTLVEGSLPTIALFQLSADTSFLGPYRALYSPAVVVYCLFIILSTLRLRPGLCLLAGAYSAAGYVGLYLYTHHVAPQHPNRYLMPRQAFLLFPIMIFLCGAVCAFVAQQIRRNLLAALAEAETRRKLDRIELELSTARSIQMGLLPQSPPVVPNYDIAGWSQPAEQTGGDFYDWITLPDGRVLFAIADATGHGIGPALLVVACRAYFRARASGDDPLERITQQVDALLAADVSEGRFVTAAVALLDPAAHALHLYSAGHAPLYLYTASRDELTTFGADQPPLGMGFGAFNGAVARVIPMSPGDALVLVTDGFFECHDPTGAILGAGELGAAIRRYHASSADQCIRRLHEEVLSFARGAAQRDDMTAVVIKRQVVPV
jgi:serine phosphatase RsbU (regulator of sigma subunit)